MTHDFLISALDDAVLFFRVSCGEGMHELRQTLVSVYDVGSSESNEVLEDAPSSLGRARRLLGE